MWGNVYSLFTNFAVIGKHVNLYTPQTLLFDIDKS